LGYGLRKGKRDIEAERPEAPDTAMSGSICIALIKIVFSKVFVSGAGGEDAVSANEQLVANG